MHPDFQFLKIQLVWTLATWGVEMLFGRMPFEHAVSLSGASLQNFQVMDLLGKWVGYRQYFALMPLECPWSVATMHTWLISTDIATSKAPQKIWCQPAVVVPYRMCIVHLELGKAKIFLRVVLFPGAVSMVLHILKKKVTICLNGIYNNDLLN